MNWENWIKYLEKEKKRFQNFEAGCVFSGPKLFSDFQIDIPRLEADIREQVDNHIRHFIVNGTWPKVTKYEKYFIFCRLDLAITISIAVLFMQQRSGEPVLKSFKADDVGSLLEGLLIDYWDPEGRLQWFQRLHGHWLRVIADNYQDAFSSPCDATPPNQIVSAIVKRKPVPTGSPASDDHSYECFVTLNDGAKLRIYLGSLKSLPPPSLETLQEILYSHPERFARL